MMLLLAGCLDHTPVPGGEGDAFVAMQADFADYRSWSALPVGAQDTGHVDGTRVVYLSGAPPADAASFPVGTRIVKTITWSGGTDLHAMVKRGGGFNPDGAFGWEWFELVEADDGTPIIKWRGDAPPSDEAYGQLPGAETDTADTITGDCNVCHGAVAPNDYVHSVALGG